MSANNLSNASLFLGALNNLFGSGGNNNSNTFGVPLNQLRQAGQSEASSAEPNLALQQKYADQAANSNYNYGLLSKIAGGNVDAAIYQTKSNIDTQSASDRLRNQLNAQSQSPGSSVFGGYSDGIYNYEAVVGGSPFMPTVNYRQQLNPQVAMFREQNKANQQNADNQVARDLAASDRQRYNQQLLANSQYQNQANLNASQYANQEKLANIDAQSRIASANISAQGGLLGSLFGSFGNNSASGRYW